MLHHIHLHYATSDTHSICYVIYTLSILSQIHPLYATSDTPCLCYVIYTLSMLRQIQKRCATSIVERRHKYTLEYWFSSIIFLEPICFGISGSWQSSRTCGKQRKTNATSLSLCTSDILSPPSSPEMNYYAIGCL
jgi:hypothetical protein